MTPDSFETTMAVNHFAPFLLMRSAISSTASRPGLQLPPRDPQLAEALWQASGAALQLFLTL